MIDHLMSLSKFNAMEGYEFDEVSARMCLRGGEDGVPRAAFFRSPVLSADGLCMRILSDRVQFLVGPVFLIGKWFVGIGLQQVQGVETAINRVTSSLDTFKIHVGSAGPALTSVGSPS